MAFLYDTVSDYDTEIELVRVELRNAVKATMFSLNTSQSNQKVEQNLDGIRKYLNQLTTERKSLIERSVGASVTGITVRRCY